MALLPTPTLVYSGPRGGRAWEKVWQFSGPASYTNPGGESIDPPLAGLATIYMAELVTVFRNATPAIVIPDFNLVGTSIVVTFYWAAAAANPLALVTNATNLSAYTGQIRVIGSGQ